jgi:hypothetical protein
VGKSVTLFSYVVVRDYGFAPNPFYGTCSLATCKPEIRKVAQIDDWVVGTGSRQRGAGDRLIYCMQVSEILSFNGYWGDPRFQEKKPFLMGSKKQAYGDNIYFKDTNGLWRQENSHHSLSGGRLNRLNVARDTKADCVLLGAKFAYWGSQAPRLPARTAGTLCKRGPGHKSHFSDSFIAEFVGWVASRQEWGYLGAPADW